MRKTSLSIYSSLAYKKVPPKFKKKMNMNLIEKWMKHIKKKQNKKHKRLFNQWKYIQLCSD